MAANDVWRLSVVGDWGGTNVFVNTFHVKFKSAGADAAGACASLKALLLDDVYNTGPVALNARQINANSVNLVPAESVVYTTGFPIPGAGAAEALPFTNAAVVTLRTAYAGRSYRGRVYLPTLTEAMVTGSTIAGATVAGLQGFFDAWLAAWGLGGTDADYQAVIYSRELAVATPVTAAVVRAVVGTVRRRRPGVGV